MKFYLCEKSLYYIVGILFLKLKLILMYIEREDGPYQLKKNMKFGASLFPSANIWEKSFYLQFESEVDFLKFNMFNEYYPLSNYFQINFFDKQNNEIPIKVVDVQKVNNQTIEFYYNTNVRYRHPIAKVYLRTYIIIGNTQKDYQFDPAFKELQVILHNQFGNENTADKISTRILFIIALIMLLIMAICSFVSNKKEQLLRRVWILIDFLQLCNILLVVELNLPENLQRFLNLLGFSNLFFIPNIGRKDNRIFSFFGYVIVDQYPKDHFQEYQKSSNCLINSATKIIILLGISIIVLGVNLFYLFLKRKKIGFAQYLKQCHNNLYAIILKINQLLFLDLILNVWLQFQNPSQVGFINFSGIGFAILLLLYLLGFLIIMIYMVNYGMKWVLHPEYYERKLGEITFLCKTSKFSERSMHIFLMSKKVIYTLFLVYLYEKPLIVLLLIFFFHISFMLFYLYIKPFDNTQFTYQLLITDFLYCLILILFMALYGVESKNSFNTTIIYSNEISQTTIVGWFIIIIIMTTIITYTTYYIYLSHQYFQNRKQIIQENLDQRKSLERRETEIQYGQKQQLQQKQINEQQQIRQEYLTESSNESFSINLNSKLNNNYNKNL